MKAQQVYTEVSYNTLTAEQRNKTIKSRWVLRQEGDIVRARIVAKGYTEEVKDNHDIYASTPIFCVLRLLLTMSLVNAWKVRAGDISTAFLHSKAATDDLFMLPPTEFYNPEDQVVWKLNKAIYALRSSPHTWQKHCSNLAWNDWQENQTCSKQQQATHSYYARTNSRGQTVHRHPAAPSTTANRRSHSRQHHQLPRQEHHQQG